MFKANTIWL